MTLGQLAILPVTEERKAERRIVNLAARLREPGASLQHVEVVNLSTSGFLAQGDLALEIGTQIWLKLPGLEPKSGHVVWVEEGKAGCEFASALHPADVELISSPPRRRGPQKRHFGPLPA